MMSTMDGHGGGGEDEPDFEALYSDFEHSVNRRMASVMSGDPDPPLTAYRGAKEVTKTSSEVFNRLTSPTREVSTSRVVHISDMDSTMCCGTDFASAARQSQAREKVTSPTRSRCSWMFQSDRTRVGGGGASQSHALPDRETLRSVEALHGAPHSQPSNNLKKSWRLHQDQALWLHTKEMKLEEKRRQLAFEKNEEHEAICTFKPKTRKKPSKLYDSGGDKAEMMDESIEDRNAQWAEKRDLKIQASRDRQVAGQTDPCTFRPQLSTGSKALLKGYQPLTERTDKFMEDR